MVGVLLAVKLGYKGTPGKFDWKNLGVCTLRALPSLSLIIVVIGGIIGGVFSLPPKALPSRSSMRWCWLSATAPST